jgi:hypothetical protein
MDGRTPRQVRLLKTRAIFKYVFWRLVTNFQSTLRIGKAE